MQNKILFRGKRTENDNWVIGNYSVVEYDSHKDLFIEGFEICNKSFGQYINLNYKDGRQAFTGDLFRSTQNPDLLHRIWFSKGGFVTNAFQNNLKQLPQFIESLSNMQIASWFEETCYYVGNVFDNPELMEVAK